MYIRYSYVFISMVPSYGTQSTSDQSFVDIRRVSLMASFLPTEASAISEAGHLGSKFKIIEEGSPVPIPKQSFFYSHCIKNMIIYQVGSIKLKKSTSEDNGRDVSLI